MEHFIDTQAEQLEQTITAKYQQYRSFYANAIDNSGQWIETIRRQLLICEQQLRVMYSLKYQLKPEDDLEKWSSFWSELSIAYSQCKH